QHRAVLSGLVPKRIAAQAVVAAEQDLPLGVEPPGYGGGEAREKEVVPEIALVIARFERQQRIAVVPVLPARRCRRVEQEQLAYPGLPALRRVERDEPGASVRAEGFGRDADRGADV